MFRLPLVHLREAGGFPIPPLGLIGAAAVREAFEGDLRDLQNLLQGAIKEILELAGEDDWWPYVHGLFEDSIVVEMKDGKLMSYPYTIDGTAVALGTPVEVRKKYVPVEDGGGDMVREALTGLFMEADGDRYRIRVVQAGLSANGNFYPDDVLQAAVPLFEGARVFVKADQLHLAGGGKDFNNLIGGLRNVEFVEGKKANTGELQADLILIDVEGDIARKIREAWDKQLTDLFGFSIDAAGKAEQRTKGGRRVVEVKEFVKVHSVDLIIEPGAGGAIINLLEAKRETVMDREELIALLEAKGVLTREDAENKTDTELKAMLTEAVTPGDPPADDPDDSEGGAPVTRDDLRMIEARTSMRERIDASSLPDRAKTRLKVRFGELDRFAEAEVTKAIQDEADYLAEFTQSGTVRGLGEGAVRITESRFEKVEQMFEAFFDPAHKDHRHARSFKECYIQVTGDWRVSGRLDNCDQALLRESLNSASLANVLGDSIRRRMIADYNTPSRYAVWRQAADIVPVTDFRTNERTRIGGYGDLPAVAQGANYAALTSPTDEVATYGVSKRGGTEDLTWEMIVNDDVGVIRRIPINLSRAAQRTLAKFVLDFMKDNPTIYDALALFHATHNNLAAAALDGTSLAAARVAMLNQTELDSGDRLNIGPANLWVPTELEEAAADLFRRNTENDRTFIQSLSLNVIPVWYWTDTNDWVVTADNTDIPLIEMGFLNGNEEPELFVQDMPEVGSVFTADKVTYKIRHVYGGNVLDFRGFYKSVVI